MLADTCVWRDDDAALISRQANIDPSLVHGEKARGSILLLATTHAHIDFAANLIASLGRVGIQNYALLTPDEPMLGICEARGWACALSPSRSRIHANASQHHARSLDTMAQHSPLYNRFTWERLGWIECVLLMTISVLFLDTDSVVMPGFARAFASLNSEVVVVPDSVPAKQQLSPWSLSISCDNLAGPQTNPAFSAWRADDGGAALALLRAWRSLEPLGSSGPAYGDMRGLKLLLRGGSRYGASVPAYLQRNATAAWGTVTLPAQLPSLDQKGAISNLPDDSTVAATTISSRMGARNVSWRCLPPSKFCNCAGKRQHGLRKSNENCVWVHMNCLASHAKVNMMKSAGFWFLDDQKQHEDGPQGNDLPPPAIEGVSETRKETRGRRHRRSHNRLREMGAVSNELDFNEQTKDFALHSSSR